MLTRMLPALVALALGAWSVGPVGAQVQEPHLVATGVAECVTATMRDDLSRDAWAEELADGWRVNIPLRGQPAAQRDVQSAPPHRAQLAWFDLRRYDDESGITEDWNAILPYRVNTSSGIYIVDGGGYFWFRSNGVTKRCLEEATGGAYQPQRI